MKLRNRIRRICDMLVALLRREPAPGGLFTILNLTFLGQAVYVATKLGIPDHLVSGPKTVGELAKLSGAGEPHLQQIMLALAGFGIFAGDGTGRYRLTPMAEPLISMM